MAVECAFGRLKERFRMLKSVMSEKSIEKAVMMVVTCCVLHNMFLHFNDGFFCADNSSRDHKVYFQPNDDVETSKIVRLATMNKRRSIPKILYYSE